MALDLGNLFSEPLNLRLPRAHRLANPKQFKRVFSDGTRFSGGAYVVLARLNEQGHPRLGLAISKRAARRAVDRNRLKRLARESFRTHLTGLPPVDIVLLCAPKAAMLPNQTIFSTLSRAWYLLRSTTWAAS